MDPGRVSSILCATALAVVTLAASGCWRGRGFPSGASGDPSCSAVCSYYVHCRELDGELRQQVERTCTEECTGIYVEGGNADTRSLRQLQRLECSELTAFIEGPSGRMPGQPMATSDSDQQRKQREETSP